MSCEGQEGGAKDRSSGRDRLASPEGHGRASLHEGERGRQQPQGPKPQTPAPLGAAGRSIPARVWARPLTVGRLTGAWRPIGRLWRSWGRCRGGVVPAQLPEPRAIYGAEQAWRRRLQAGACGWQCLHALAEPPPSQSVGQEVRNWEHTRDCGAERSDRARARRVGPQRSSRLLGTPFSRAPCSGRGRATRPVADGVRRPRQHPCTARSGSRRLQLRRGSGTGRVAAAVGGVNGSPFQLHLHLAAARTLRHGRAAHQRWVPAG